jgi:hypothetical protein
MSVLCRVWAEEGSASHSRAAIQTIIVEEMTFWFNTPPGGSIVGAPERYTRIAQQIWEIQHSHLQGQ